MTDLPTEDKTRKVTVIFEYADKKETWIFDHETDFLINFENSWKVKIQSRSKAPQIIRGPRND